MTFDLYNEVTNQIVAMLDKGVGRSNPSSLGEMRDVSS